MCNVEDNGFSYVEASVEATNSMFNGQRKQAFEQIERCPEKAALLDYTKTTLGVKVAYDLAYLYFAQKERQDA